MSIKIIKHFWISSLILWLPALGFAQDSLRKPFKTIWPTMGNHLNVGVSAGLGAGHLYSWLPTPVVKAGPFTFGYFQQNSKEDRIWVTELDHIALFTSATKQRHFYSFGYSWGHRMDDLREKEYFNSTVLGISRYHLDSRLKLTAKLV